MTPEGIARKNIDRLLAEAGWKIQDRSEMNLGARLGVAMREWPFTSGPADYLLFVGRKPVGGIEAKPEGATLSGVAVQSDKYLTSAPLGIPDVTAPLTFGYESTGIEMFFRDIRDKVFTYDELIQRDKVSLDIFWLKDES